MGLERRVVLVTGAGRGLGAAIARAFGQQGSAVVVNYYRSEDLARSVVEAIRRLGGRAVALQADVRDLAQVESMVREAADVFGQPVDVVVNNALVNYRFDPEVRKPAWEISWDDYQAQIDGTLKAAFNTVRATVESMMERKFGRIINIGTNLLNHPVVAYHDYTTAKAALLGFTRNLAQDLGPYNITVNTVAGGLLRMTDASSATTPEVFALIEANTPLRRVTTPEDVAQAVLFFASDWAAQITGQYLVVDGGLVMPG
ncbi:3-oxoacyl-ACP reductase [Hydrogenibacillus sp. N12]|uniref:3-oxoacyl-ACP reductase n=1 Tax=Hydrogenibacillus sp. N12 TaxID=2866627 RepID=UPI001C7D6FD5|nr:3-oxoacyl-ACP reductase [Hydrogenibacillus sp. N12]QZA34274.1 3-oxoacyl-ACP reductase [Hydrogenibacillus sp. N12]